MFVAFCDEGAVIYNTTISILASVESSDLFHNPIALGRNTFQSNTVILCYTYKLRLDTKPTDTLFLSMHEPVSRNSLTL
jgi:hypothetical protein